MRHQCFLDDTIVCGALGRILALIHRLAAIVRLLMDGERGDSDKRNQQEASLLSMDVSRLSKRFDEEMSILFNLWKKNDVSSDLCLRLNFNYWLESVAIPL
eukprot:14258788-Ditylum_brightwellii.AAC.1